MDSAGSHLANCATSTAGSCLIFCSTATLGIPYLNMFTYILYSSGTSCGALDASAGASTLTASGPSLAVGLSLESEATVLEGSAEKLGMSESLYSSSCVRASSRWIWRFSLSSLSLALTANWLRNCTVVTTKALTMVMDFLGSIAAAIMLRRGFSYTAKFLESVKLTVKEAKPPAEPAATLKLALTPQEGPSPPTSRPFTMKVLEELHAALPGEGDSHSPKLRAHITSINPTLKSLFEQEGEAQAWVKEYLSPGPVAKVPKSEAVTADTYPGLIAIKDLVNFQRQIVHSSDKYSRGNKQKCELYLKRPKLRPDDIKYYPGSELGPEPQDDPEAWVEWFINNQPRSLYALGETWSPEDIMMKEDGHEALGAQKDEADKDESEEEDAKEEEFDLEDSDNPEDPENSRSSSNRKTNESPFDPSYVGGHYPVDTTPETFLTTEYNFSEMRQLHPDREYFEGDNKGVMVSHSPMGEIDELPIAPHNMNPEYEKGMMDLDRWAVFRMMPQLLKYKGNVNQFLDDLQSKESAAGPIGLPSVIPYFETLPKWFQEQRCVQGFVTNLERYKPEMTRLAKEEMINLLCYYLTPKDPKRLLFLQEFYEKKYLPRPSELEGEDDYEEMDIETQKKMGVIEETAEMKVLKILGEESGARDEEVLEIGEIEDYGVDWFTVNEENPKGKLPITLTYYDNADGYWDNWIRAKRDRYGPPEIVTRKHFKH